MSTKYIINNAEHGLSEQTIDGILKANTYVTTPITTSTYSIIPSTQGVDYYGVSYSGTCSITISGTASNGKVIIIKDESGLASSNHIVISGYLIDGSSSYTLSTNNGGITMVSRNYNWWSSVSNSGGGSSGSSGTSGSGASGTSGSSGTSGGGFISAYGFFSDSTGVTSSSYSTFTASQYVFNDLQYHTGVTFSNTTNTSSRTIRIDNPNYGTYLLNYSVSLTTDDDTRLYFRIHSKGSSDLFDGFSLINRKAGTGGNESSSHASGSAIFEATAPYTEFTVQWTGDRSVSTLNLFAASFTAVRIK